MADLADSSQRSTSVPMAVWKSVTKAVEGLKGEPEGIPFPWGKLVVAPIAVLGSLTLLATFADLDYGGQMAIFKAGGASWSLGDEAFWQGLYQVGTLPAIVIFGLSTIGFLLSWYRPALRGWRRVFLFNMLMLLLACGVITNGLLKEYWGRPRPGDVEGLGGHNAFERVLTIDPSSEGKSFPSGHATMGFYFLGGYFLLRRHRTGWAEGFLFGGLIFGGLLGIARMAQGGHFFSDVVWAGAVCYFTALGLYFALGLHRGLWRVPDRERRQPPIWAKVATVAALGGVTAGLLLATPYRESRDLFLVQSFSKEKPLRLNFKFTEGKHDLGPSGKFSIQGEAYGHGVPTSRIAIYFAENDGGDVADVVYHERISGRFTEINEHLKMGIPWHRVRRVDIILGNATLFMDLGKLEEHCVIRVASGLGRIELDTGSLPVSILDSETNRIRNLDRLVAPSEGEACFQIKIENDFAGIVNVVK